MRYASCSCMHQAQASSHNENDLTVSKQVFLLFLSKNYLQIDTSCTPHTIELHPRCSEDFPQCFLSPKTSQFKVKPSDNLYNIFRRSNSNPSVELSILLCLPSEIYFVWEKRGNFFPIYMRGEIDAGRNKTQKEILSGFLRPNIRIRITLHRDLLTYDITWTWRGFTSKVI